MTEEAKRGTLRKVREYLDDKTNMYADHTTAQIRGKFLDRWAELSGLEKDENGAYDYSLIDYDNKWVKLEWYLCDPAILLKVGNPKYREIGLSMLPEDCIPTYYEIGPGNDKPYSEVYVGMEMIKKYAGGKFSRKNRKKPTE